MNLRRRLPGSPAGRIGTTSAAPALAARSAQAPLPWHLIFCAGLIALWALTLAGLPAGWLPLHAASWTAFLALVIAPGYLLADLAATVRGRGKRRGPDLDVVERLALSLPLGVALLALPGIPALLLHWTVDQLAVAWAALSGAVVVVWMGHALLQLVRGEAPWEDEVGWRREELALAGVLLALYLLMLPALTLTKIDGDAYAVNSFAADALAGLPLNASEPLFGTDLGPGVRMAFNQSLPLFYLWSYFGGIEPNLLVAQAARPLPALWALLATYMLGMAVGKEVRGPLGGRRFALTMTAIQALVYLAAPFLRGDNVSLFFFERTTADKFMVPVTMLPVIFALGIRYLAAGGRRTWGLAAVATFAVSAIHPLIAAMLALGLGALAGLHGLLQLGARTARLRSLALGGLIALALALPVVQLVLARGEAPLAASYPRSLEGWPVGYRLVPALPFIHVPTLDVYGPLPDVTQLDASEAMGPADPFLVWRFAVNMNRRRLLLFDLNRYVSDPNIILEPPYLLALVLAPLLLPGLRRRIGAQFALGASAAVLLVMFNPVVTPLLGSLVMPWIFWRFVWLLPYALILTLVLALGVDWAVAALAQRPVPALAHRAWSSWVGTRYLAPVLVVALTALAAPLIVHNLRTLHERAAFPYFYPTPQRLLTKLDELTRRDGPAVVLADQDLSVSIPAYVAGAHIVAHRAPTTSEVFPANRQDEALQRLIDQAAFFRARYLTAPVLEVLRRYNVGYVVAPSGTSLEIQLRLAPAWFTWIMDDQSYSLYAVHPALLTGDEHALLPPAILGNGALAERRWDEATALYQAALVAYPGDLLALVGLAEIAHARGRFNEALARLEQALAIADLPVLHYRMGVLLSQLGRTEQAVAAFLAAQEQAPFVARYHVAAGDACLRDGQEVCAAEQYAQAVANRNLPDEASRLIALADLWRQRGRTDRALALYADAVAMQPSAANQLMLAGAYFEEKRYAEAAALLRVIRIQRPLSIEARSMAAEVAVAQGDLAGALRLYRRAILLQDLLGQESATTRLALARTLLDAGRAAEAQRELARVLRLQPNLAAAHALQGDIHSARRNAAAATLSYQTAFRLDPTQVQHYLALSNQVRRMGGASAEMLDLLEAAMRANPNEPTLALALGDHLQRQGELPRAVDAYLAALDLFEQMPSANSLTQRSTNASRAYTYIRLAGVSEDLALMEPAMNYYSAAVAAAPDLAWTQVAYGDALRRRNQVAAAEAAYRRAIANDPNSPNAYVQLADLLTAAGNPVEAAVLRHRALDVALVQAATPATASTRGRLGLSAITPEGGLVGSFNSDQDANGDPQARAGRLLGELASDASFRIGDGAGVLSLLTRLSQTTGNVDQVIHLYQRALEQGRREEWTPAIMAQYHKGLGDLYLAQGLPMLAADAYRSAMALDNWWPQAQLGLARALESLGQPELALAQLEDAVAIAPGYVEAQIALARFLEQRGRDEEAFARYNAVAARHPGNPLATIALARAQQSRRLYEDAERTYRRTIALTPGHSEAYGELAALLMEQARYHEAEPMILAALETNQRSMSAHVLMGVLAQQRGDATQAVDWFKRAMRVRPDGAPISLVLIDLLQRYGHYELSLTYLDEAVRRHPTDEELILRQARAYRLLGRNGDALAVLLAAARLNITSAPLSAELGEVYLAQGRPEAALAAYRQTVALAPEQDAYYIRLAALWQSQAQFAQAEAVLRAGLGRATRPASLYAALSDLYLRQGKAQDAKSLLEGALVELGDVPALVTALGAYYETQAVQGVAADDSAAEWYLRYLAHTPDDPAVLAALAAHYLRRNQTALALERYAQVVALTPTDAGAYRGLAEAYVAAGRATEAIAALEQARILEPASAEILRELAQLYRSQGRITEAQALYQRGRELAPADGPLYVAYGDFLVQQGDVARGLEHLAQADQVAPTVEMLLARAAVYAKLRRNDAALADLIAARAKAPGSLDVLLALGDLYRDLGDTANAQAAYAQATKLSPGIAAGRVRMARLGR